MALRSFAVTVLNSNRSILASTDWTEAVTNAMDKRRGISGRYAATAGLGGLGARDSTGTTGAARMEAQILLRRRSP
jgi:hypothetical protein